MTEWIADRRDVDFVLFEQLDVTDLSRSRPYEEFDGRTIDLIITEARKLAVRELLPVFADGDRDGCRYEQGRVWVPASFHRLHALFQQGEWIAMSEDRRSGGQGMPFVVTCAAQEYFHGANPAFMVYPGATREAARLVELWGTDRQKALFLERMYSGRWAGCVQLTEEDASSDLGACATRAGDNGDGTYRITGGKVFVSGGEQDLTENIVHVVLAGMEGAPTGTERLSLFLVPKVWINDDGSLAGPNEVECVRIEEKMGLHGAALCAMSLGVKAGCRGLLLGQTGKALHVLSQVANEARFRAGLQGLAAASAAYRCAVHHARGRRQGRDPSQSGDPAQVPIMRHPDVRRMLLWMKAHVEGMRSLVYFGGLCRDRQRVADAGPERESLGRLVDLLAPLIKGYCSDRAFEVCTLAVQVYGGRGYINDFPAEQLLRDCKAASLYAGTNGLLADGLVRQELVHGEAFADLLGRMGSTLCAARGQHPVEGIAHAVRGAVEDLSAAAGDLKKTLSSGRVLDALSFASPFLEVMGDVTIAWMLLWRACTAWASLSGHGEGRAAPAKLPGGRDAAFYEGQVKTARYYAQSVLPITLGKIRAIRNGDPSVTEMTDASFGA